MCYTAPALRVFATAILVFFTTSAAIGSQELEIIRENRSFYVLHPDGGKVEIVKEHTGGALNVAVLSPDSKFVFYTDGTGIGFESSGKDLFYCKPDGTERTFLHKIGGNANNVSWINRNGHYYILFLEVWGGAGRAFVDLLDFTNRKMILKIEGWVLKTTEDSECFVMSDGTEPHKGSKMCLDSLLSLGDPDKYNVEIFQGYGYPNELYLSTRREPFLNPDFFWDDIPQYAETYYGGLGQCFPSRHGWRTAFCVNMDSKSWVGVLNNKTKMFQFSDSITVGEYKYNFAWSYCERYLAFVKSLPGKHQEIVVLEFLGNTGYTVKQKLKLEEEREVELVGWSIRKGGFEYMLGEKEFLEIHE